MPHTRRKVFRTFSLTAMTVPAVGEALGFVTSGQWAPSTAPNLGLTVVNAATLLYARRTRDYVNAFRWSIWASLACFTWSAYLDGGLRAAHYDFVYLFIFTNVFFHGGAAVVWSSGVVLALTLAFAAMEHVGALHATSHPLGTLTFQSAGCQILVAFFIYHFERARRQAAREAAYQRELLKTTFDFSPAMHFTKDVDGRYLQVNRAFLDGVGLTEDDVIGRRAADLMNPEVAALVETSDRRVLDGQTAVTFPQRMNLRGESRLYTTTLFPIRNFDGSHLGVGGIILDTHEALALAAENQALTKALNETALVLTVDTEGRVSSANDNFCATSGFAREELIGRTRFEHAPAHDVHLFAAIGQAVKLRRSWTGEIHEVTRDGREYILGAAITPIVDGGEVITRYLVVCFDLTPQVLAEVQYRSLVDTMEEGVILWTEEDGILQSNRAAQRMLELTEEELGENGTLERMRKITREDGTPLSRSDYPAALAYRTGQALYNQVIGVQTCDGRQSWITVSSKPITVGGKRVVLCTLNDVSAQRETLRELRTKADELHSLFQAMTEGMFAIDAHGILTMINRAGAQLLGYEESELIGVHAHQVLHHSHPDGSHYELDDCPIYQSLTDRSVRVSALDHFWTKDGRAVPVSMISVPLDSKGGSAGILVTFRDLTEIKRLEHQVKLEQAKTIQSAKLASLGEMSAGVAHEINNPLAIVTGNLSLLARYRGEPEKFDAKLAATDKAAQRIAKIVRGLQKFARATPGQEYRNEPLGAIVGDSVIMTETKARRHDVEVRVNETDEYAIFCDVVEMEQVLINLINNSVDAIKALPRRWIELDTFVDGAHLVLKVTDAGQGLAPEVETKLFQPFFTTKPVGQGTGLGLSIVRGILEQHGASITINHQQPNTCFEIRFTRWERVQRAA